MTLLCVLLYLLISNFALPCSTRYQDCPQPNMILSDGNLSKVSPGSTIKCNPARALANASCSLLLSDHQNMQLVGGVGGDGPRQSYGHGTPLTLDCTNGFVLIGSDKVTCMNGEWSPPLPHCKDPANITCPVPTAPINMALIDKYVGITAFPHASKVTFECLAGYEAGSQNSTCTSAGTWTPVTPACVRRECGSLG